MISEKMEIDSDTTVKDLLSRYPKVGKIFIEKGLLCFGCPTEAFHTLAEVSELYELDLDDFTRQIVDIIESSS